MQQVIKRNLSLLIFVIFVAWLGLGFPTNKQGVQSPVISASQLTVPCEPGAALPNLTLNEDGTQAILSWVQRNSEGVSSLMISEFVMKSGWTQPEEVVSGDTWFVNWADFPSVSVLDDGTRAVHWLDKISADTYAYGIKVSIKKKDGIWSEPVIPHSDISPAEHGFLAMRSLGDRFYLTWLDGRETLSGKPMTLRATTIDADGTVAEDYLLDDSVCDCCPVDALVSEDEAVVFYRDRDHLGVRDIAWLKDPRISTTSDDSGLIHEDNWILPGCPVNGPAVAGNPDQWATAWYTEADRIDDSEGGAGAVLLRESGKDARDDQVYRLDRGNPLGRVDIISLRDGSYVVSWLEKSGASAEILLRHWVPGSEPGETISIGITKASRESGFPKLILVENLLMVAYTAFDENGTSMIKIWADSLLIFSTRK